MEKIFPLKMEGKGNNNFSIDIGSPFNLYSSEFMFSMSLDKEKGDVLFKNKKDGKIIRGVDKFFEKILNTADKYTSDDKGISLGYSLFSDKGLYNSIVLKDKKERERAREILRENMGL